MAAPQGTQKIDGNGQPLRHEQILAEFQQGWHQVQGQMVRVVWKYRNASKKYTWNGRILAYEQGKIRVFYHDRQEGFPKNLPNSQAGIEVLLPRDDVLYYSIEILYARQTTQEDLARYMIGDRSREASPAASAAATAAGPGAPVYQACDPFDVTTWSSLIDNNDTLVLRLLVSQAFGHTSRSSLALSRAVERIHDWIEIATLVDDTDGKMIRFGQNLMEDARLHLAAETHKVTPEQIVRQMKSQDDVDPLAKAVASLTKEKHASKSRIKCTFCGKFGHEERDCFRKNRQRKNELPSGNKH